MLSSSISEIISMILVLLISFPVHEFSHAFMADYLGDDTPRLAGRVTLNPFAHLDFIGTLMFLVAGFGWAKPVPVNYSKLSVRSKHGPVYVSLAGPVSNLIMAFIGSLPFIFGFVQLTFDQETSLLPSLSNFLWLFILFNLILFFFNILPLFPLDGEKVLLHLLPEKARSNMVKLRRFGSWPLLLVVMVLPTMGFNLLNSLVFSPAFLIAQWLIL